MERTTVSVLKMLVRNGLAEDISKKPIDYMKSNEMGMKWERLCYSFSQRTGVNGGLFKGRRTGKVYAVIGAGDVLTQAMNG